MRRRTKKALFPFGLIFAQLMLIFLITFPGVDVYAADKSFDEYNDFLIEYHKLPEYSQYIDGLKENAGKTDVSDIIIEGGDFTRADGMKAVRYSEYEGRKGTAVLTGESGMIEYEIIVQESGMYTVSLEYFPVAGNGSSIQRAFFIDGQMPYSQLKSIDIKRIWSNAETTWRKDNQGNELRPEQKENPSWAKTFLYDRNGYVMDPLAIYLEAGKHTLTIVSIREPLVIGSIVLDKKPEVSSYEEVSKKVPKTGLTDTSIVLDAELADRKSSSMLYPTQDQSSPSVTPYSAKCLLNNTIGGYNWQNTGEWLEWSFNVPKSGNYVIWLHDRQNFVKGIPVSRRIMIDGLVPFTEFESYQFKYKGDWRIESLSDEKGTPYEIYLDEGEHTLRMEVVLGDFASVLEEVESILQGLNEVYRKVIKVTGVSPDSFRDYQLEEIFPTLPGELDVLYKRLDAVIKIIHEKTGNNSSEGKVLVTMRDEVQELSKNIERFAKVLDSYKTDVSALGTWIGDVELQPMELDTIYIQTPDMKEPKVNDGFFSKLAHEVKRLYYSFIIDYNVIGNVADEKTNRTITVWVGSGRDQANVLKLLADERFTYKTGISVNVMLVNMGTLLQATLTGEGPDVALGVGESTPMNYGLRNAVQDLSIFPDLKDVYGDFYPSAWVPFTYGTAVYGVPETQSFPVMFYRKDILSELGLEIPRTWDDVKVDLSVLSNSQMDLGMLPGENLFSMLLFQNGEEYYRKNGAESNLDSDTAINVFKEYCSYYNDYSLDRETSLTNRFRTGEAPIIIADYTTYNELMVSAHDIRGLWGFTHVPGTLQEDGSIVDTVSCAVSASVMMKACKDKEAAWEFMKWWISAETQSEYGKELESIMGEGARYATANIAAMKTLPWTVNEYNLLSEQMQNMKGIPQVPGGYFTWRNIDNAFAKVVVSKTMSAREALTEYVGYINDEIDYKRKEFKMKVEDHQKR